MLFFFLRAGKRNDTLGTVFLAHPFSHSFSINIEVPSSLRNITSILSMPLYHLQFESHCVASVFWHFERTMDFRF